MFGQTKNLSPYFGDIEMTDMRPIQVGGTVENLGDIYINTPLGEFRERPAQAAAPVSLALQDLESYGDCEARIKERVAEINQMPRYEQAKVIKRLNYKCNIDPPSSGWGGCPPLPCYVLSHFVNKVDPY